MRSFARVSGTDPASETALARSEGRTFPRSVVLVRGGERLIADLPAAANRRPAANLASHALTRRRPRSFGADCRKGLTRSWTEPSVSRRGTGAPSAAAGARTPGSPRGRIARRRHRRQGTRLDRGGRPGRRTAARSWQSPGVGPLSLTNVRRADAREGHHARSGRARKDPR